MLHDTRAWYQGKQVLVTGGLGFLGSTIAHALVPAGAQVVLLDALLPQYGGNMFNVRGIEDQLRVVTGDIRDPKVLSQVLPKTDVVFNLAAQVSYLDSLREPFLDVDMNCVGHLHVLEAVRKHAPEAKVCFASSRLVYGKILTSPVDESHPTNPLSIYGVHKLSAEKYHRIYLDHYGMRTSVLRIPNPYGPRQQMRHSKYSIVGWFIRQALEEHPLTIFGTGEQERDYLYVDDIVDAFLRLGASAQSDGEVYNVGATEIVRFVDMVDAVLHEVGTGTKEFQPWPAHYERNETGSYRADTRKIAAAVGWRPHVGLHEGIRRTVQYYRLHHAHYW